MGELLQRLGELGLQADLRGEELNALLFTSFNVCIEDWSII